MRSLSLSRQLYICENMTRAEEIVGCPGGIRRSKASKSMIITGAADLSFGAHKGSFDYVEM